MIKKISAIVLALVLCLSVVVMPASAYSLGANSEVAYIVELDADKYSAGDTVWVNIYLYGKAGLEFGTGAIVIGMNSAVFDMDENVPDDVKANGTGGDAMASWYKDVPDASWAWQTNATVLSNIEANNTAEENAMFDQYLKITLAKNSSGSHPNVAGNKNGLPAEDINADSDAGIPFISIPLKLKDDLADSTAINVGIPTGTMPKNYTYMNYYKNPGSATTVVKTTAATSEVVFSTTAQIGAATVPSPVVSRSAQIRFNGLEAEGKKANFDVRTRAAMTAADFTALCGADADAVNNIESVGFIYYDVTDGATFDKDTATEAIEKATANADGILVYNGYVKMPVDHIQKYTKTSGDVEYRWTCFIGNAAYGDSAATMGYIVVDGVPYTFDAEVVTSFSSLYDTYYSQYAGA